MASTSNYRLRGSTSADTSVQWKYDVFLSFRGEDTRKNFADHLYKELQWRGIKTFRDDPDLERGTVISPELLAAIEQSRFAVVVLSPNYASSTWCLLELGKIVACMGERRTILPIFYEVDPSDVRHQTGSYAEAFAKHKDKFGDDLRKGQEWRNALTKVANLAGWSSKDYRYDSELIKEIVNALWMKVYPTLASSESESLHNFVGIDSKLMEIQPLFDTTEANYVCFIGIWGMGGIGKTTLARQVHNKISRDFEVTIFLPDVRQISTTQGLVHQQEQLICQIMMERNIQVHNVDDGVAKIKRCLFDKKVLLILDDVDQLDQLEKLAGERDWFGSGSIVIVTTRDQRLLHLHGIVKQYKSKGLNEHEALQLFSWKAFKKDYPEEGYGELSKSILDYARGLPLALKILGSFLYKRDRGDWESTVANLKKVPIDQVLFGALRISYDGLDKMEQQAFLDVACFLKGNDKERVIQILDNSFGFDTRIVISVLIEKSLLTLFDNRVDMHDLIQEMGREVVRLESEQNPGQRSRLWLRDDIFHVLKQNTGTEAIRSISVCFPKEEGLAWNPNAFSSMSKLKFLKMQNLVLCPGPEYLPDEIRVLEWTSYPSNSLPLNFHPADLVELTLHHSNIHHLWHGIKNLNKLTIIDLSFSDNLTETPDFTGIQNLERLVLEGCKNLVYIHPSITSLRRLKILNFKNCQSIMSFPGELEMDSLEILDLSRCSRGNILLKPVEWILKLSELSLSGIGWQKVSYNSGRRPYRLRLVLASLKHLCSLKGLHLNDCKLTEGEIPDDIGCLSSLEHLDLSANNFVSLPASISRLSKLKCLNLADCKRLEHLPCLPLISCTCHVTADNCVSLKKLLDPPEVCRLWNLSFNFINCRSIIDGGIESDRVDEGTGFIYSMLQRFLQEPPPFFEMFSIVIPGSVIPWWFKKRSVEASVRDVVQWSNQNAEASVTERVPDLECSCRRQWMGFALCVVFGAEENPGVLGQDHDLEPHTISCSWKPGAFLPASVNLDLSHVVKSDHLCLFLLPSKHYHDETIDFDFQTMCATNSNACLKVKGCGVRVLYKRDVEDIDIRMSLYDISERIFVRLLDKTTPSEVFSFVLSGNEIPKWFVRKTERDSVVVDRPCIPCSTSWIGFALCVLFEENTGDVWKVHEHVNIISCCWENNYTSSNCSGIVEQVVQSSDHLCVFFVPRKKFLHSELELKFHFNGNLCLKVKGCGIRRLYEEDLKQPYMSQRDRVEYSDRVTYWVEQLSSLIK